ncbi:hypothetical protein BG262_02725 [Floricoccus penangensis]|uniref:Uncharacterized protein n=1 Tax=Floricoccus penangensis TaxID=1859475 RepID=A0A9Q5NZN7_9LACT|nr:ERF family protein [Floricoccus penangensis]OFI46730.1 hypothetical protein BG262_02725 [Floricoccus penangensis]
MAKETKEYGDIYEALSAVQQAIVQPSKDGSNPMFKSDYVTLDGVVMAINDAIKEAQAKIFWTNYIVDNVMVTDIRGYGDQVVIEGSPVATNLGNRGTNEAQAMGSALTYARRYSLSMAFGITSNVDDDGNAAKGNTIPPKKQSKPKKNDNGFTDKENGILSKLRQKLLDMGISPLVIDKNMPKEGSTFDEFKQAFIDLHEKNVKPLKTPEEVAKEVTSETQEELPLDLKYTVEKEEVNDK